MKLASLLNTTVNVMTLGVVTFLLVRPSGPVGAFLSRYRDEAAVRRLVRQHWQRLERIPSRLDGAGGNATLVEFSDFECPYCMRQHAVLRRALATSRQLRIAFVHLPMPSHASAEGAARAAICAEQSGQFAALTDRFFQSTDWQRDTNWVAEAAAAGIDTVGFRGCLHSARTTQRLDADRLLATQLGVNATPTFVTAHGIFRGLHSDSLLTAMIIARR
ncbi:MAG: thioredoxin domain-containing protein [Gemmatimonadaceae bacterium]|nr:thioredoxin domain-containing protein [Gemmatimonadaceae bacterium]